jgi:hypothetical protein
MCFPADGILNNIQVAGGFKPGQFAENAKLFLESEAAVRDLLNKTGQDPSKAGFSTIDAPSFGVDSLRIGSTPYGPVHQLAFQPRPQQSTAGGSTATLGSRFMTPPLSLTPGSQTTSTQQTTSSSYFGTRRLG